MRFDFKRSGMLSIQHLRFKRLWIGLGLMLISLVAVASVVSIPAPLKSVMLQDKVVHMLVYASLMGWFSQIYRHDLTRLVLVLGLIAMGVGMEFVQGMVPARQFEVIDMVANTSGVLLAWALAYTWVGNVLPWAEKVFCKALLRA